MRLHRYLLKASLLLPALLLSCGAGLRAQQIPVNALNGLRWRLVGPHRAGRVTAVAGIADDPTTYYIGTPGGGVWKTTSGGVTWEPIFDDMHVASIGAIAVAPSNPNIVYVGTGEQSRGNGVYKSIDAGKTWAYVGLAETRYISSVLVNPHDANVVFVGASGEANPSQMRGVFKSTDGGKTWRKVLYRDDRTAVMDLCFDPGNPRTLFASIWHRPSLISDRDQSQKEEKKAGPDSEIYKSTDGGESWRAAGDKGLPSEHRGRIGLAVAPETGGKRIYAILEPGFYRSDDAGESWQKATSDPRVVGSWYFSRTFADPKDPNVVYVMQTAVYRSSDGGHTFEAYKGGPSGEDHHVLWIAPNDPHRIIDGTDQGATVTLNGGRDWTLWFNQPTGQFYHVAVDDQFPYHMYAAQQDSGSVVVPSRSDFGEITYREWYESGAFESGYIAPDPKSSEHVFSVGWFGTILRLDRATGQVATLFVPPANYRTAWETPLLFSPRDSHTMYSGAQYVLKSTDNGLSWKEISPDLTQKPGESEKDKKPGGGHIPPAWNEHEEGKRDQDEARAIAEAQLPGRGVVQTIATSPLDDSTIWAGTSNGMIWLTRDAGAHWLNVTPPNLPPHALIGLIETSPHDANSAYASLLVARDNHPHLLRTRDAGKSWTEIVSGLPDSAVSRTIREDPARSGLLFAGTETEIYFSYDSGDHWQSLQLNLPAASMRDIKVHGRDLVLATFGRGLWILDDITPLRDWNPEIARAPVHLFAPQPAMRVRWDNHPDTPLNREMPAAANPPDGATIDYSLANTPQGEITLDIRNSRGDLVRHYSSIAKPQDLPPANVPEYWFAPPAALPIQAGANRFVWDLRYAEPQALPYGYFGALLDYTEYTLPDHAIPGQTPRKQPAGALVVPGQYELTLTVDGKSYRRLLTAALDPRVRTSQADLEAQLDLARQISSWMSFTTAAYQRTAKLHKDVEQKRQALADGQADQSSSAAVAAFVKKLGEIENGADEKRGFGALNRDLARYFIMIESGDLRPTDSAQKAVAEVCKELNADVSAWNELNAKTLSDLNNTLQRNKLSALEAGESVPAVHCSQ